MVTEYTLKSGKKFGAPALFVNPQSTFDAIELKNTLLNFHEDTEFIEGIVIALKDWNVVKNGFNPKQSLLIDNSSFNNKPKILDSSFHILFQGYSEDKNNLMNIELEKKKIGDYQLISGGLRLRDVISAITALDKNKIKEKNESYIKDVYPYTDNLVNPVIKFAIENKFDVITVPSVPITYFGLMDRQITQAKKMNKAGKIIVDTLFSKEMQKRDLMFLLTVNMSVIKQENYDDFINALIINDESSDEIIFPDQIGIRLMNDDTSNTEAIQSFLDFIARLAKTIKNYKKEIPIHIFNVRENGYVMFAYGATTITSPIATSQYIRRSSTGGYVTTDGKYYHPVHMMDYRYEKLLALSRSFEYILPCHCKVCKKEKNFLKAKEYWNSFRRQHFILAKHLEMQEIKEAPSSVLNRHLQQKFSRSKQTVWLAFLDQQPILTFN